MSDIFGPWSHQILSKNKNGIITGLECFAQLKTINEHIIPLIWTSWTVCPSLSWQIILLVQEQFSLARVLLGPFYQRGLSPAWISNHTPVKVWGEITYPFPSFNGANVEVWEWSWISNFILHFIMDVIMLGLKLIHVSKRGAKWHCF